LGKKVCLLPFFVTIEFLNINLGLSRIVLLQHQVQELQKAEVIKHERNLKDIEKLLDGIEMCLEPEREFKRIKLDSNSTMANQDLSKQSSPLLLLPPPESTSPVRSIIQGLATQILQAALRELTSRGRLCECLW
jgi:hypothetical protein